MLKLREHNGTVRIEIESGLYQGQVEVYYGGTSTLSLEDKTKIGTYDFDNILFPKPDLLGRIYYVVTDGQHTYMVSNRKIALEGTFNTRDFGGYRGYQGKQVKWGVFYRSDALGNLTSSDEKVLTDLGIKTIVDFRGAAEIEKKPDIIFAGAKYVNLPPHAEVAQLASGNITDDKAKVEELVRISQSEEGRQKLLSRRNDMEIQMRDLVRQEIANEKYQQFLELFLNPENTPIIHHCMGGKDRAGFGAVVVLMALGVEQDTIMQDYMLTREFMAERNERRMAEYKQYTDNEFVLGYLSSLMQTQENYLAAAFDEIHIISGSFENYLKEKLHINEHQLAKLREYYLY